MKFITIFDNRLHSYKDEQTDEDGEQYQSEWHKTYSKWMDFSYVHQFFEENEHLLLTPYFKQHPISKVRARQQVYDEALNLRDMLKRICEATLKGNTLDEFFKPLDNHVTLHKNVSLTKGKSTLYFKPRLLRVYAVRISENEYVLTGGAIKLVLRMQDHNTTFAEKLKMDRLKTYLNENGVVDKDGFYELINEQDGE